MAQCTFDFSQVFCENCEIIRAGVQLVRSASGPAILAGDFDTSLTAFDDMKALLADRWVTGRCCSF